MTFAIMNTQQVGFYTCIQKKEGERKRKEKTARGREKREREEKEDMRIRGSSSIGEDGTIRVRRGKRLIRRDCNHITLCNHDAKFFKNFKQIKDSKMG